MAGVDADEVGSEVMFQSQMVRSGKMGEDTKMAVCWKLSVWLTSDLNSVDEGVPYH